MSRSKGSHLFVLLRDPTDGACPRHARDMPPRSTPEPYSPGIGRTYRIGDVQCCSTPRFGIARECLGGRVRWRVLGRTWLKSTLAGGAAERAGAGRTARAADARTPGAGPGGIARAMAGVGDAQPVCRADPSGAVELVEPPARGRRGSARGHSRRPVDRDGVGQVA